MTQRLFGTDGIRGIANSWPMTSEMALRIGRAAGHIFQKEERVHTFLIGKDTRLSGYMFENALTAGLCSMGVNVLLVGPLPTPGVSYIMRSLRCDAAIMVSASHNPFQYNGIKFFGRDGFKIADEVEEEIGRLVMSGEIDAVLPAAEDIGQARRIDDAVGRYIEFAKATFPKGMRLDGLRIVCDCAHGASYKVGPTALSELGAQVIAIGHHPNGRNINEACGSTHAEEMRATVIRERADVGIAFDGDGDRVLMADEEGRMIDGNAILTVLALDLIERELLPEKTVVTTIMANAGLERALAAQGGKVVRAKVGDRYVVEAMRDRGLTVGGEPSGHIVMLEHNVTGDALIAALQVLSILVRRDQPLSALAAAFKPLPEAHVSVPFENGQRPAPETIAAVQQEADKAVEGVGTAVIRASGTEPIVRVMVQHERIREAQSLAQKLADRIRGL